MYRDKPNANSLNVRIYAKFRKFAKPSIRAPIQRSATGMFINVAGRSDFLHSYANLANL
jgi:hypothetical protein